MELITIEFKGKESIYEMASGNIVSRNKYYSDIVTDINGGTGTIRLYKRNGICTMVVEVIPSEETGVTFTLPDAYIAIGAVFHQWEYKGQSNYVYFYANNTNVTIVHTGNDEIADIITYMVSEI